jgi:hypothetical protein
MATPFARIAAVKVGFAQHPGGDGVARPSAGHLRLRILFLAAGPGRN